MATILFYEGADPAKCVVAAYDQSGCAWREEIAKKGLALWLKERLGAGAVAKEDEWVVLLAEGAVTRIMVSVPSILKARERQSMAENALTAAMGQTPGAMRLTPMGQGEAGEDLWLAAGILKEAIETWEPLFGAFGRHVQWAGAADGRLAFARMPLADGYYLLEAPLWTAVLAIESGAIIASAAAQGRDANALHYELLDRLKGRPLPPVLQPWGPKDIAPLDVVRLRAVTCKKIAKGGLPAFSGDKTFLVLLVGCVVLPGLLWLGAALRPPAPPEENGETASVAAVSRTNYSTLIAQAYNAKSERIVLLNHEAADGALAVCGRAGEALDVADYMRRLSDADIDCHPLLLDMTKKTEKERYYYEFVVRISSEGGAQHEGS